jgi:hypothetical protein
MCPMEHAKARSRRAFTKGLAVGLIPLVAFVVLAGGLLYGQGSGDALFIDKNGNVGIGTSEPKAELDVNGTIKAQNVDVKGKVNTQDLKATGTVDAQKFEGDGSALKVEGSGVLKAALDRKFDKTGGKVEGSLDVTGLVRARTFESTNPLRHRMYPDDPAVYQDIFEAKEKGAIAKLGGPQYDETSWGRNHPYYDRPIIRYGGNNEKDGNGAKVIIPKGYDTVWVRVTGDRWNVIHAYSLDSGSKDLGFWAGGKRIGNSYCPDGSLSDSHSDRHQWLPIPAGGVGSLALISYPPKIAIRGTGELWLSGLAFSKNPWAHAAQSALGYHWAVNGGSNYNDVKWENDSYLGDVLARIDGKTNWLLKVPVVPSGRDKLLYVITHNSDWNDCAHSGITVNGQKIERFMATYDNPFARHWNSKVNARYIAARIPSSLIPQDARFLDVKIDMSKQNMSIKFREIGTHDLDMPQDY